MLEENLLKSFQQVASGNGLPLLLNQHFLHDEFTTKLDQQTSIYQLPLPLPSSSEEPQMTHQQSLLLSSYELLAYFSSHSLNFVSQFQDLSQDILDFPSHLLPSLETSLITFPSASENEEKKNSKKKKRPRLYFRLPLLKPSSSSSPPPSAARVPLTLYQHLSSGKWISEKLLFRWTIQILRTLRLAHERFLSFPSFHSQHIHLLSDEMILASYRLQSHSVKQRNKKQEEELKSLRIQSRVSFGTKSSSSFSSSQQQDMKLPDISSKKLQFKPLSSNAKPQTTTISTISSSNSVFSTSSSSLTSQSQATCQHLQPALAKLAPRKDAWILLPLDDSLAPVDDLSEVYDSSQSLEIEGGQDDGGGKEVLPKLSKSQSFRKQSSIESTRDFPSEQGQLENQPQTTLSAWLRRYQINPRDKEFAQTMSQFVAIAFRFLGFPIAEHSNLLFPSSSESISSEIADLCRQNYTSFVLSVYQDLRSLGSIIIESYLRRPLSPLERKLVDSSSFGLNELFTLNSFDRLSKGMMDLLHLCYTPLTTGGSEYYIETKVTPTENHHHTPTPKKHILRSNLLKREGEILTAIEKEFEDLGGFDPRVGHKDNSLAETFWTKEVQEEEEKKKAQRLAELERKANVGKKQAHRRNIQRRKQLFFDMLPEEQQQAIIRKKYFRKLALTHQKERNQLVSRALFHCWGMNKITQWVREALLNCLKKNYYLKKSGVRMSLEQKHEWDRTVRPIERAIGKILLIHPYVPQIVKIDGAQALLLQLKDRKHPDPTKELSSKAKPSPHVLPSDRVRLSSSPNDELSNPSSPSHSRPTTAEPPPRGSEQERLDDVGEEEKIVELDEMTPHEKEIRYLHCFDFVCHSLASLLANEAGTTISIFEDRDLKSSLTVAKFSQRALENATETLEKSAVASNLPPEQFREKMLVAAAKKLGGWDAINIAVKSFGQILGIRDQHWFPQMISFVSFGIVSKYGAEERIRAKGEAIAASRIQGVGRGYITRKKIKEIWRLADEQFEREEVKRLEREKEIEEMNRIISRSKIRGAGGEGGKDGGGQGKKEKLFKDEDASWVEVSPNALNSSQLEIFIKFQKDCMLPKDENRRSLQIKPIARILRQPGIIPDPECTSSTFPSSPVSLTEVAAGRERWRGEDPCEGLIEVIIDDLKRIIKIRQDWTKESSAGMMECSLKWEDVSQRNKRLSSSIPSSGPEDEAVAFLQIWNLIPHRRYRLKLMVNSRYRPTPQSATPTSLGPTGSDPKKKVGKGGKSKFIQVRDDPEEIRLSRAGYLSILTDPDLPLSPELLQPDIIHYDRKVPLDKTSSTTHVSQLQRTEEENIELLIEDCAVSVVDKLERYKDLMAAKRTATTPLQRFTKGKKTSKTKPLDDLSACPPIDHRNGVTERCVSCRLHWTIPYSNGNKVREYQIQRLNDHGVWESLTTTCATHFTDTLPAIHAVSGLPIASSAYRVRASNEFGWSPYSDPFTVDLIDKISCHSPSRLFSSPAPGPSFTSRTKDMTPILPHGISLLTQTSSPARLLSSQERDMLVYSNMYSLPPVDHLATLASTTSSVEVGGGSSEGPSVEYGRNPARHPDSTLAGETLLDVNKSLEQWLCRLADTCPLDETRPLTQSGEEQDDGGEKAKGEDSQELQREKKEDLQQRSLSSFSVLESIYKMSGITENETPIPRHGQQGQEAKENLIQKLVVSHHKTKTVRPPTQSLEARALPNKIYVPR